MKRDWELIRRLLLWIQEQPVQHLTFTEGFEGYSAAQVNEHLHLLSEAGLLGVSLVNGGSEVIVLRMTWKGHELTDLIGNDMIWERLNDTLMSRGLTISLETIQMAGTSVIKGRLGI